MKVFEQLVVLAAIGNMPDHYCPTADDIIKQYRETKNYIEEGLQYVELAAICDPGEIDKFKMFLDKAVGYDYQYIVEEALKYHKYDVARSWLAIYETHLWTQGKAEDAIDDHRLAGLKDERSQTGPCTDEPWCACHRCEEAAMSVAPPINRIAPCPPDFDEVDASTANDMYLEALEHEISWGDIEQEPDDDRDDPGKDWEEEEDWTCTDPRLWDPKPDGWSPADDDIRSLMRDTDDSEYYGY